MSEPIPVELKVELGDTHVFGQRRYASITICGVAVFSELVNDTEESPASINIQQLFGEELRRLLLGDV